MFFGKLPTSMGNGRKSFTVKKEETQMFVVRQIGSFAASVTTIYSTFLVYREIVPCTIDF